MNNQSKSKNNNYPKIPPDEQGNQKWYYRYKYIPQEIEKKYIILSKDVLSKENKLYKMFGVFYNFKHAKKYIEKQRNKNFYVIIKENKPCRIYLDYDFYISENMNKEKIREKILKDFHNIDNVFNSGFRSIYNKNVPKYYIFDSSDSEKVSIHIEFDKYHVSNNQKIKPFVKFLRSKKIFNFDDNVYSRNRQWRLPENSKINKNNKKELVNYFLLPDNRYFITDISKTQLIEPL